MDSTQIITGNDADADVLWKQYALHVDLYKFYLDLALKFNVFYYGITGAILSFYLSKSVTESSLLRYSLWFPVIMSVGFSGIMFYAASAMQVTRFDTFDLRDKLRLATAPEFNVLSIVLRTSAILVLVVAVVLAILCCCPSNLA